MKTNAPFDEHVSEYEAWYEQFPFVFQSEVAALREMLPEGEALTGIEVGLGTGRVAQALGIKEGIEPSVEMRTLAVRRGIEIMDGVAEELPYGDLRFDFVLMNFCISYFRELHTPFKEAYRVLKNTGALVVGFLDRNSPIGRQYEEKKPVSTFYRNATFYTPGKVLEELRRAGFRHVEFCQTLFNPLDRITSVELPRPGYGDGSFVVARAMKRKQPS